MTEPAHPRWQTLLLVAGAIVCMCVSIFISTRAAEQARLEQRRSDCSAIRTINDAYRQEAAELSDSGREIAGAWEYLASKC